MLAHAHQPPFLFSLWPLTSQAPPNSAGACESPNPTHAAAGAASHRRSEDKLRVYFQLFRARVLFCLCFSPRNELSGRTPPPARPDSRTLTSTPPTYRQTRTHSHTHTQHTHTGGCFASAAAAAAALSSSSAAAAAVRRERKKSRWWHGAVLS